MKIVSVDSLAIPEIKAIQFARFRDHRGYFTEPFRRSDLQDGPLTPFMQGVEFVQSNESFSKAGTIRGLHFQWNPFMGKLVRTISGHMIDLVLDIRKGSPTFGKLIALDMPGGRDGETDLWVWVPPGFAHGNVFLADTLIEYLCSGEYSQGNEAGISPLADDIDWSLCDGRLRDVFEGVAHGELLITDKDRNGLSVGAWKHDERSRHFIFDQMPSRR